MATLIPALSQCLNRMQSGEKRLARRLEEKLEDDYLLWYDVPIGGTGHHPDFVVLHPRRGILVLEVKDWKLDTLAEITKGSAILNTSTGLKHAANPLEQARTYATEIASRLEKDPALREGGGRYRGRLLVPWSFGVVLSSISRKQFTETDLGEVLPADRVICRDEMTEEVEPEEFQSRLWRMMPWEPERPLSLPQLDRIRWHLFPEVRITQQLDMFQGKPEVAIPDLLRVMDLQQEQLARSLGDGHRVIHGVAGSGKTMILGYRCLHLAKALRRPILVLCFNRALASWLEEKVSASEITHQVAVRTFHGWCREELVRFHAGLPPSGLAPSEYADQLAERVIRATDRGLIPREQYGAVLVDEGHDFKPEWLKLITQMVSPETNSLLLLYDDAQSIYGRQRFSFRSVGVQARGRTTVLRLNYRNTAEILEFAYAFARHVLQPTEAEEDEVPLIAPESAGRHGPPPQLIRMPTLPQEVRCIAGRLQQLNAEGTPWRDMAVLHRNNRIGAQVVASLTSAGIPNRWVGRGIGQKALDAGEDSVKVLTFHSSKGLEFPVIAIPDVRRPRGEPDRVKEETRLLYVAMTRAIDRLILTGSEEWLAQAPGGSSQSGAQGC